MKGEAAMKFDGFPRIWRDGEAAKMSGLPPGDDVLFAGPDGSPEEAVVREMQVVLHAGERHGAVCPRLSSPGGWTSFPLGEPEGQAPLSASAVALAHARMASGLPRYGVIPGAPRWPILVRGDLVRRFGGPDAADSSPLAATWRYSQYGYSTVVAHRALVHRGGGAAADPGPAEVPKPLAALGDHYLQREVHPLERFARLFSDAASRPRRLLFGYASLKAGYNGTSEYGLTLLRELLIRHRDRYEITVLTSRAAAEFHGLRSFVPHVVSPGDPLGVYDLGFLPCQVVTREELALLDRHCLRMAFTLLDLIWFRCGHILARDPAALERLTLALDMADGATTISAAVQRDVEAFFPERFKGEGLVLRSIPLGRPELEPDPLSSDSQDGSILMVGNTYVHKALPPAMAALAHVDRPLVVLGGEAPAGPSSARIAHFPSGTLPRAQVERLYRASSVLVFPSQYEGFGLPVARALALGKPVVLFSNDANREAVARFSIRPDQAVFCDAFDELPKAVEQALRSASAPASPDGRLPRTWADTADDTARFFDELMARPIDAERLLRRARAARGLRDILAAEARACRSRPCAMARTLIAALRPRGWRREEGR